MSGLAKLLGCPRGGFPRGCPQGAGGVELVDIGVGDGDAAGGSGASFGVAVDEDFAAQGGVPEFLLIFFFGEVGLEGGEDVRSYCSWR